MLIIPGYQVSLNSNKNFFGVILCRETDEQTKYTVCHNKVNGDANSTNVEPES